MGMPVQSLSLLSKLRFHYCHELWCRSQMWLWHRLAAMALIQPLAWELPYTTGAALEKKKKNSQHHQHTRLSHVCSAWREKQWEKTWDESQNTEVWGPNPPLIRRWPSATHWMLLSLVPSSEKLCVRLDNLKVPRLKTMTSLPIYPTLNS